MSYHQIIIVGNLGKDPEMRYTPDGKPVTSFTVAANRCHKNNDGKKVKDTVWFKVSAWGKVAETCNKYLKTGSKVLVVGRMNPDKSSGNPRVYERNDGSMGANYEVVASQVTFLTPKNGALEEEAEKEAFPF